MLWTLRSRELVEPLAFWGRVSIWLSAIGLFSWLVERLQIAMIYSTRTWMLFPSDPSLRPLTYPVWILIWATVVGIVIITMLRRTVGASAAVPIGVLACIPLECQFLNFLFEPSTDPLDLPIRLFQVGMPILMVAEAGSVFERMTAPAFFVETKRGVARLLRAILDGRSGLIASGGLYAVGGLVVVIVMRSWNRSPGEARSWIWVTLHLAVFVLSLFAVIGAGVATWWKLGRMSHQPTEVNPLAILGKRWFRFFGQGCKWIAAGAL